MCSKNRLLALLFALTLASCATPNRNKTTVSSDIGYVSQDNLVIQNTGSVQNILDDANDCNFLDKFVYYSQKYTPQVPNPRYQRRIYSPYGYGNGGYKKPVVCNPTTYTNVGGLWTIPVHQNLTEAMHSQTVKRNAKAFQFNQNGVAVIAFNNAPEKSCFVLTNAKGTLIPVRNGADPYLFSNPLLAVKQAQVSKQNKVSSAKSRLHQVKNRLNSTYAQLKNNRAWRGSQCALPKQRALPRKPKTISMEEAQFQANGYCTELSARRENPSLVTEALGAIFLDQTIKDWMQWRQTPNRRQSCALVERSQLIDMLSGLCGFSKNAMRGCIQTMIKSCVSQSINQCTGTLQDWYREVATIRQEPRRTYQACLQNKQLVKQYQASIPDLETNLRQAQAISLPHDSRTKVSLANAVCNRDQRRAGL